MSAPIITPQHVIEARRELSKSLVGFVRLAWSQLEPGTPYVHGRHIDVIAEHLEAVHRGEIKRLLINVPPGAMKSLLCGVFFPAWEWGAMNRPDLRYVGIAHEQTLGVRDNLKCRRLIESQWYRNTFPHVQLVKDQNEKLNFENMARGFRQVATPSNVTGKRADRVVCDDLLSAENANSEAHREGVNRWYRESLPTRLNKPSESAIINIMQRLHERDCSGLILAEEMGYETVIIPMRYEPDRKFYTSLGPVDWRSDEGELMFPERFPEDTVAELEKTMGAYGAASQLQQRPAPREGGLFKESWFNVITALPDLQRIVRAWDFAATKKAGTNNPDWTAGVKVAKTNDGKFIVMNTKRLRGSPMEVEQTLINTAALDGSGVTIRLPQDPGQAGKAQAEGFIRKLAGYAVKSDRPTGDKATRAAPAASQAEIGNVYIYKSGDDVQDAWIRPFLDELCLFPAAAHDDQVDAFADAINELALGSSYNINAW